MPITVLHVLSGDLWAGAEVQAFNLMRALHRRKDVRPAAVLMNPGELAQKLEGLPISVRIFDERRLNSAQILGGLVHLLREVRPDIVHTHRFKENILGSLANRLSIRAMCVRTVHGAAETAARTFSQRASAAADRWCGNHLQDKIIAVTPTLATQLAASWPKEKLALIENGIDIESVRIAGRAPTAIPFDPANTHIGIAGRLTAVKRADLFLQTAAMLRQQDPGRRWQFHLFGEGPLRQSLMKQAETLGLNDVTCFHGHRNDVAACIARLDVLIMCSDHEGLPMTLLEAMALGSTIVGHAVGGIDQLLQGGLHGWPVADHTAAGYAQAVRDALVDPAMKAARARAATTHVERYYSAALSAERHLTLYSQLLSAPDAAASPV